jgi:diaminobutyrate-2-oxoglutarate transaminase
MLATVDSPATSTDPRAVFLRRESAVRSYCRGFPAVFVRARGAWMTDENGRRHLDFLSAAGALNYGHNDLPLRTAVCDYLASDGPLATLDLHSGAKRRFLEAFERCVLAPRGLDYKVQFTGPTGTNAVEAALKLARKVTGRSTVVAFTNGYHGMSLGALAATGNRFARGGAGLPLGGTVSLPYDGYLGSGVDTLDLFARQLADPSGGLDLPAAVLLECVQGEGGLNAASTAWLQRLEMLCRHHGILLIVDDIQAGCGRTGPFFSFEAAGITPDLVVLSKSIGGLGLPLSLVLIQPEHDRWAPGEHNGTFRGNCLAFVAGAAALETYWRDDRLVESTRCKGERVGERLAAIAAEHPGLGLTCRGRGLMRGLHCPDPELAARAGRLAWNLGLIVERCGPHDEVLKVMPPLTIPDEDLDLGLGLLARAVREAAK